MRPVSKKIILLMAIITILLTSVACGIIPNTKSASQNENVQGSSGSQSSNDNTSNGPVKVVWWHSMGGELGKAVDQLVANFNSSQNQVKVEAIFQGSYDESLNKLKASLGSNSGPAMVQVYEIGSRFMIDSKAITPIQKFIDEEHYDVSQLENNIINYYTINNQLYSMPFNTSNPILYYNKDMFRAAGLDPEKPPVTYEEVEQVAKKLSGNGKYGASFAIYAWFIEQFFANQGSELVNNGNGRDALATESLLNSEAGVKTLTWWKGMIDSGAMLNLGRSTADTKKAFAAGQVAMILDSTAALRGIIDSVGNRFEVGTGFLPKPQGTEDGGVIVGGASLYVLNNRPEAEQKGAWEFIKYLVSAKQQAYWHINTGYFPITKEAYNEPSVIENMKKFPQFKTAVEQLHATVANRATQGALMGVFPEARQIVEKAMEEVANGQKSPQEALDTAANEITKKIQQYNRTIKQ